MNDAVNRTVSSKLLLAPVAGVLLALIGCAVNPVTGQQELVLVSENQEIALGRQYHPQILREYGEYQDPQLQAYVNEIGQRLAAQSHRNDLVYRFTVLDSAEVNAFALPGGYIYITRGLIGYMNSEAELAAVLGHEIGHVTARHSVRQQTASTAASLAYTLGSILVPEIGGNVGQNLYGVVSGALLSGYGREMELEADGLGAEYLARTGYDARAILEVLGTLKAQEQFASQVAQAEGREPQSYHGLFASHPDNDTRLQEVVAKATFLAPDMGTAAPDQAAFRAATDGMVFGDSAKQGIRRGNRFYHADMGFAVTFPEGWALKNLPDSLVAVAPQGKASAQLTVEDINKRIPPEQFIRDRLGVKNLSDGSALDAGGLQGYSGLVELNTRRGRTVGRLSVIYLDDKAFVLLGAPLPGSDASAVHAQLLETARGFHRLTAAERKLAEPLRITWRQANKNLSYDQLARDSRIPGYPEQELRLINSDYPEGSLTRGEWYKTVQ